MKISQREARRLKKRIHELEYERAEQRNRWVRDFPGGIELGHITLPRDWFMGRIEAARMLGYAIVATEHENTLHIFAVEVGR